MDIALNGYLLLPGSSVIRLEVYLLTSWSERSSADSKCQKDLISSSRVLLNFKNAIERAMIFSCCLTIQYTPIWGFNANLLLRTATCQPALCNTGFLPRTGRKARYAQCRQAAFPTPDTAQKTPAVSCRRFRKTSRCGCDQFNWHVAGLAEVKSPEVAHSG